MNTAAVFDPGLLARIEDAGINASAPREQLWMDGWLLRFSPGKAKRARCVQAVAPGQGNIASRIERARRLYDAAGLRLYVRITPFSKPDGLDAQLEAMGMVLVDDTRVMVAPVAAVTEAASSPPAWPAGLHGQATDAARYVDWVGTQRGSSASEREAHLERLRSSPVAYRAMMVVDDEGGALAGGQIAIENDVAGIYDVFTSKAARNRGLARELCRQLVHEAARAGVETVYLQVDAANEAARHVYFSLGFTDGYAYHYRAPPA